MDTDSDATRITDDETMDHDVDIFLQRNRAENRSNSVPPDDDDNDNDERENITNPAEYEAIDHTSSTSLVFDISDLQQSRFTFETNAQINENNDLQPSTSSYVPENEGEATAAQVENVTTAEEDDGYTCPICFDNWTNMGDHRICSLKCGHIFGLRCIKNWFTTYKNKNCPTCKVDACTSDIRFIYARQLKAADVTELESLKMRLTGTVQEKNRIQLELHKAVTREQSLRDEVRELKVKVHNLDSILTQSQQQKTLGHDRDFMDGTQETFKLNLVNSMELSKDGGCRVLDYYKHGKMIMVSSKSPNPLFPGYGVRAVNHFDYKPLAYIPLHSKPIRDVQIHYVNPWLLTAALDTTLKIINIKSNATVGVTSSLHYSLWSCCWDANDPNMLYAGTQHGCIIKFDVRRLNEPLRVFEVTGDMSPVVSLAPIAVNPGGVISGGGIVACKLNSLWVFENDNNTNDGNYTCTPIQIDGPFSSTAFNNNTRQLLVSTRSNSRYPHSRHLICDFKRGNSNELLYNVEHCFTGSTTQKYLSRSTYVGNNHVAAYQESDKCVALWSAQSEKKTSSFPAYEPILDLNNVTIDDVNFLFALSERQLHTFRCENVNVFD